MGKKLIGIAVIAIMLFGIFGLTACTQNLADYKAAKITELQDYADAKEQSNYCESGWAAICNAVTDGKAAIEAAKSKPAVTTAYNDAKNVIDEVKKENIGMFRTLQEAYDEGLLTAQDLQTIANYHANGTLPAGELSTEIASAIKELAAKNMRESELTPVEDAKAADFSIIRYYGVYNGSVALMINDPYHEYPAEDLDINETIAGVLFHYTNPNRIIVWKQ